MAFLGIETLDPEEKVMRMESECAAASSSSSSMTAVRHSLSNVSLLAPVREGLPALPLLPSDSFVSPCNQPTLPVLEISHQASG